jgi:hypothetical protein
MRTFIKGAWPFGYLQLVSFNPSVSNFFFITQDNNNFFLSSYSQFTRFLVAHTIKMRFAPIALALLSNLALVTAAPVVITGPDFDPKSKGGVEYHSFLAASHFHNAAVLSSAEHASPEGLERDENRALGTKHLNKAYDSAKEQLDRPVTFSGGLGPPTSADYGDQHEKHLHRSKSELLEAKQIRKEAHSALKDPMNHVDPKIIDNAANDFAKAARLEAKGNQSADEAKRYHGLKRNMEDYEEVKVDFNDVRVVCMACVSSYLMIIFDPQAGTRQE